MLRGQVSGNLRLCLSPSKLSCLQAGSLTGLVQFPSPCLEAGRSREQGRVEQKRGS